MSSSLDRILSSDRLPTLPEVVVRIIEIAKRPDPDFSELVEIVRMDPAIAGRILKAANSALFGIRTRAASVEAAVPRLGTTMVRTLVLSFFLVDYQKRNAIELQPWYQQIWRESLTQAAAAEALAERQPGRVDPTVWFLAGLMQDIGRLAMLAACPDEYVKRVLQADVGAKRVDLERAWFGFTHVEVGTTLCRRWNLDEDITHGISVHHALAQNVVPLRFISRTSLPAALITAAQISSYKEEASRNPGCGRERIDRLLTQIFGLRSNEISELLAEVDTRVDKIAVGLNVEAVNSHSREAVLSDAQHQLSQIAINSQLRLLGSGSVKLATREYPASAKVLNREYHPAAESPAGAFTEASVDHALTIMLQDSHGDRTSFGVLLVDFEGAAVAAQLSGDHDFLKRTTEVLRHSIRMSDCVCRSGEYKLLIALSDINADMLILFSDQIRRRLDREFSTTTTGHKEHVGSLAAVLYTPSGGRPFTPARLLDEVHRVETAAKKRGESETQLSSIQNGRSVPMTVDPPDSLELSPSDNGVPKPSERLLVAGGT